MQKRHRIFIAINLPADVRKFLAKYEQKLPDLPARWTSQQNLHITLVFLGDLTDEELGQACVVAKEIAAQHAAFEINLEKVGYGPDNKIPPKMLWASGQKSKELSLLKNDLQDALLEKINFKPEFQSFNPHVTLARITAFVWRQIEPEERSEVSENIDLNFLVESIDVMESELKKGGPEYTVIETLSLEK